MQSEGMTTYILSSGVYSNYNIVAIYCSCEPIREAYDAFRAVGMPGHKPGEYLSSFAEIRLFANWLSERDGWEAVDADEFHENDCSRLEW